MNSIKQFKQLTGCPSDSIASHYLRYSDIDRAIDNFFTDYARQTNGTPIKRVHVNNRNQILEIFNKYADKSDYKCIDIDGTMDYFTSLGIDVENDVSAIIAAYILESPSTGVFLKDPFVNGWCQINAQTDTLEGMAKYLQAAKGDNNLMKRVYKFAFKYALDEGEKKLDIDAAIMLWKVFFRDQFIQYEQTGEHSTVTKFVNEFLSAGILPNKKQISRDEWDMALLFFQIPLTDLDGHSSSSAWPLLMDDFVDFLFGRL